MISSWSNTVSSTSSSNYNSPTANINYDRLFNEMKNVKTMNKKHREKKVEKIIEKKEYMFNPDDLDLEGIK